jgi:Arc/MetJ-type ribon-helix-helix transcriptional regulator
MVSNRITVRVPKPLEQRLQKESRSKGKSPSDLVRAALEAYLESGGRPGSAREAAEASGLIGCVEGAPADLSISREYFKSFGKGK